MSPTPHSADESLDALVERMLTARRRVARAQVAEADALAHAIEVVHERSAARRARDGHGSELPLREVAAELGCVLRVSDRTVQKRISLAHALVHSFPATRRAWRSGRIEQQHAWMIVETGVGLEPELRACFEEHALAVAMTESAGRMRAALGAIAAQIDPSSTGEALAEAADTRRVRLYDVGDGLARLLADLPAAHAYAIFDRLTTLALLVREGEADAEPSDAEPAPTAAPGDAVPPSPRTLDQLRADVMSDLLTTGVPEGGDEFAGVRGQVQVTIPIDTLAGVGDRPALLLGHGPIDAGTARRLAAAAPAWERVFVDACTGTALAVDRYRASAELTRFLHVRDERCRFPGCRRPATRCDLDHTIAASEGGATSATNLAALCRRHHVLKHNSAWSVQQHPGGVLDWRSPTGRIHRDRPPSAVRFVAEAPPGAPSRVLATSNGPALTGDPPPF